MTTKRDYLVAAILGVLTLIVIVGLHQTYLASYRPAEEEFGWLLNSTRFFSNSPIEWFTEGSREYLIQYPELGITTGFVTPLANASIYTDSWLAGSPTSPMLLLTNYVGHAVAVSLVFLVSSRIVRLSRGASIFAALIFMGTQSTVRLFHSVPFRADMLGAVFGLAALLAVHSYLEDTRRMRFAMWAVALSALAVFTKETAFPVPLVLAGYIMLVGEFAGESDDRSWLSRVSGRAREHAALLAALTVPMIAYLVLRFVISAGGDVYVVENLSLRYRGIPLPLLNPIRFVLTHLLAVERSVVGPALSGDFGFSLGLSRAFLAVAINLAAIMSLSWLLMRDTRYRQKYVALLVICLAASAVPIVFEANPRYMYLGQALFVPTYVFVGTRLFQTRAVGGVARYAVAVALVLAGPVYFLVDTALEEVPTYVERNEMMHAFEDALAAQLQDPRVDRLYLINDPLVGGGLQKLEFYAAIAGRDDVLLRLVNTINGYNADDDGSPQGIDFVLDNGTLGIEIAVGESERLFGYLTEGRAALLGVEGLIHYGPITKFSRNAVGEWTVSQKHLSVSVPVANGLGVSVVGLDPALPGIHVYSPDEGLWKRVSMWPSDG